MALGALSVVIVAIAFGVSWRSRTPEAQQAVAEKSNEIPALPSLLRSLPPWPVPSSGRSYCWRCRMC